MVTANECTDKPHSNTDSYSFSHSHSYSNKKQHAHLSIKTDDLAAFSLSLCLWWSVKYTIIYCQIVPAKIAQRRVRQPGHNSNNDNNRPWFMFTCPHFLWHSNKVVIRTTTTTIRMSSSSNWSDKLQLSSLIQHFYCHFMIISFVCTERTKSKTLLKCLKLFPIFFKTHHSQCHKFYLVVHLNNTESLTKHCSLVKEKILLFETLIPNCYACWVNAQNFIIFRCQIIMDMGLGNLFIYLPFLEFLWHIMQIDWRHN